MPLETAALKVGTAVGERAVRTWLTARSTDESSREPLVELMRLRFPDHLVRRKAERQLADIADAVTARVLKLCGHEFPGLGDEDRLVVLAEVNDTLTRADLSDRALLAADADPVRLARDLRRSLPAPKDLGAVRDLSPLARLPMLGELWLCDCPPGLDLAPLAGNTRLKVHLMSGQEVINGHLFGKRLLRSK